MSAPKVSDDQKDEVAELRRKGLGGREVAKALGVSYAAVRWALDKWVAEGWHDPGGKLAPSKRYRALAEEPELAETPKSPGVEEARRRIRELEHDRAKLGELQVTMERVASTIAAAAKPAEPRVVHKARPRRDTPIDVVFHLSDLHCGLHVDPHEIPGGRFDFDTLCERLTRWENAALDALEAYAMQHPIKTVWFALGGDLTEGHDIYAGQAWHSEFDFGEQIVRLAPELASRLGVVSMAAKRLGADKSAVVSVIGNHGKPGGRKRGGAIPPSANMDYLTQHMVRLTLDGLPGRAGVDYFSRDAAYAQYFAPAGHVFLLTHGDESRGGGIVGFGVVSMVRDDLRIARSRNLNHRYHLLGHWHVKAEIPLGADAEILVNGSFVGATDLSRSGGDTHPLQRCYAVHPRLGVFQSWPIRLAPEISESQRPEVLTFEGGA